ncbi:MAG: hypothetical protein ACTSO4_00280 [Promethearchaeota archaeon]
MLGFRVYQLNEFLSYKSVDNSLIFIMVPVSRSFFSGHSCEKKKTLRYLDR